MRNERDANEALASRAYSQVCRPRTVYGGKNRRKGGFWAWVWRIVAGWF